MLTSSPSIIQEFLNLSPKPESFAGGSYGKVYFHPNNKTIIKKIKSHNDDDSFPRFDMLYEIATLSKLKNEPNIIQMQEFLFSFPKRTLYIALERGLYDGFKMFEYMDKDD